MGVVLLYVYKNKRSNSKMELEESPSSPGLYFFVVKFYLDFFVRRVIQ